jgi:hypothetical protein
LEFREREVNVSDFPSSTRSAPKTHALCPGRDCIPGAL